jgi:hypothetical protein
MTTVDLWLHDWLGRPFVSEVSRPTFVIYDVDANTILTPVDDQHYILDFDHLIFCICAQNYPMPDCDMRSTQFYDSKFFIFKIGGYDALTWRNLDHFVISTIGDQTHMQAFTVSIEARDVDDNLITNFNCVVGVLSPLCDWGGHFGYLSDRLIEPPFIKFQYGKWSGQMLVRNPIGIMVISIEGNGIISDSNAFDVS